MKENYQDSKKKYRSMEKTYVYANYTYDEGLIKELLMAQTVKNLLAIQETRVQSLGWEDPQRGNDNPLQYSCLENSMDRGAWWATIHGIAKSWTWLSD